jgi:hypothetical protein
MNVVQLNVLLTRKMYSPEAAFVALLPTERMPLGVGFGACSRTASAANQMQQSCGWRQRARSKAVVPRETKFGIFPETGPGVFREVFRLQLHVFDHARK